MNWSASTISRCAIAQPDQRCRDRMVPDAADYQRGVRHQVKPPGTVGFVRGAHRVLQARGKQTGPVLRGGQLDQQGGALRRADSPEQVAAADFGGRQRIWPAIRDLSGLVSVYLLRGHDLGWIVLTLATSVGTLDAAQRAVLATDLLPSEDRALLPGPDRIEIHTVTGYQVPAAGRAASVSGR